MSHCSDFSTPSQQGMVGKVAPEIVSSHSRNFHKNNTTESLNTAESRFAANNADNMSSNDDELQSSCDNLKACCEAKCNEERSKEEGTLLVSTFVITSSSNESFMYLLRFTYIQCIFKAV